MHFDNSKFIIELQKFIYYLTKMTNSIGHIIGGKVVNRIQVPTQEITTSDQIAPQT